MMVAATLESQSFTSDQRVGRPPVSSRITHKPVSSFPNVARNAHCTKMRSTSDTDTKTATATGVA